MSNTYIGCELSTGARGLVKAQDLGVMSLVQLVAWRC